MAVVYKVPHDHVVLINRFGKHARIQHSGLCMKLPLIERIKQVENWEGIASKDGFLIALTEQHTATPRKEFKTLENIAVHADVSLWWKITDPIKAVYGTEALPSSISVSPMRNVPASTPVSGTSTKSMLATDSTRSMTNKYPSSTTPEAGAYPYVHSDATAF